MNSFKSRGKIKDKTILFSLVILFLFSLNFISAATIYDEGDCTIYGICEPIVTEYLNVTNYNNISTYNASGNATQFSTSGDKLTLLESWLLDKVIPYIGATKNIDLGVFNLTTTGFGRFRWVDKIESTKPATPPANTLRLYAFDFKGFSVYKYLDDTGMERQLTRDSIFIVKNEIGSTIPIMSAVYDCGSSGNVPLICLARADNLSTMPVIGITIESINDGAFGRVMQVGLLESVNTNAWNEGDILYVSDVQAGNLTTTPPITPNLTQEIGTVLVKGIGEGSIQIVSRALTGDEFGTINSFTVAKNLSVVGSGVFFPDIRKCDDLTTACDNDDTVKIKMPTGLLCCETV